MSITRKGGTGLAAGFLLLTPNLGFPALAQVSPVDKATKSATGENAQRLRAEAGGLSPGAQEAANLLGISGKIQRLIELAKSHPEGAPLSDEELGLKVDVMDRIMGGALEVRMVSGRIDRELAWAFAGKGTLMAKRQKTLNYLFAANFMQGGILGVLSGPAFLHGEPKTGTELLLLASSIGLGLSAVSFLEARSGSKPIDSEITVLAYVFNLNPPEPYHKIDVVTRYMRAIPPGAVDNKTRIEILMDSWNKGHYLGSGQDRELHKLAAFSPNGEHYRENIGFIARRIRLLFDTQWTIEKLDGDLLELLRAADPV